MNNRTKDTVIIAHDYLCPWCWIGFFQAKRLAEEYPQIKQDWRGYELLPVELGPLPPFTPRNPNEPEPPRDPTKPRSRLAVLAEIEGVEIPRNRPIGAVRTHDAMQGCEYFKDKMPEAFNAYNEGVYRAFWEVFEDISDHEVLAKIAVTAGADRDDFLSALTSKAYSHLIVGFDEPAYADDITHVPTFVFRGERCAEASYDVIKSLTERFIAWYGPKE